jgi:hypothetical protein
MYRGRFQQGEELPLTIQTVDGDGLPADPTTLPVAKVYLDGATPTLLESFELAADLRGVDVAMFRLPLFLGLLYDTAGRHLVTISYIDSEGEAKVEVSSFTLLPGGSPDGAVVAMKYVERPDSRYLLWQTDGGRMVRGRNPR